MTDATLHPETTVLRGEDETPFRDFLQMIIELCHDLMTVEKAVRPKPLLHAREGEHLIRAEEVLVALWRLQGGLERLRAAGHNSDGELSSRAGPNNSRNLLPLRQARPGSRSL